MLVDEFIKKYGDFGEIAWGNVDKIIVKPKDSYSTKVRAFYKNGKKLTELTPAKAIYTASGKSLSEVDIRRTLGGDLYLALTQVDSNRKLINLKIMIKPLINWIWIGSCLMVVGTVMVLRSLSKRKENQ